MTTTQPWKHKYIYIYTQLCQHTQAHTDLFLPKLRSVPSDKAKNSKAKPKNPSCFLQPRGVKRDDPNTTKATSQRGLPNQLPNSLPSQVLVGMVGGADTSVYAMFRVCPPRLGVYIHSTLPTHSGTHRSFSAEVTIRAL